MLTYNVILVVTIMSLQDYVKLSETKIRSEN
jgi:hypothetical protein